MRRQQVSLIGDVKESLGICIGIESLSALAALSYHPFPIEWLGQTFHEVPCPFIAGVDHFAISGEPVKVGDFPKFKYSVGAIGYQYVDTSSPSVGWKNYHIWNMRILRYEAKVELHYPVVSFLNPSPCSHPLRSRHLDTQQGQFNIVETPIQVFLL